MDLDHVPIIERQCKHNSKKIIRREISEGYFVNAIDLCSKCKDDLEFIKDLKFVDKKIQTIKKLKTKSELKKAIIKRKKEIESLQKEIKSLWEIQDTMKKAPKLIGGYVALDILHEELRTSYEKYIKKLENQK